MRLHAVIRGLTANQGPIALVFAQGNYTAGEIAEALFTEGPAGPKTAQEEERVTRSVWPIGTFPTDGTVRTLDDGTRTGWFWWKIPGAKKGVPFTDTNGWQFAAVNMNPSAAISTGALIDITAHHFGRWLI